MLVSLSLFSPVLVIAAGILIFDSAARTWHLDRTRLARLIGGRAASRVLPVHSLRRLIPAGSAEEPQVGRTLLLGAGGQGAPDAAARGRSCHNGHRPCLGLDRQVRPHQHVRSAGPAGLWSAA